MAPRTQVVCFYSYKSGVGRSMAALNVAYGLASRARDVLLIDLDLQDPGISGLLRRTKELDEPANSSKSSDVVAWLQCCKDHMDDRSGFSDVDPSKYIKHVRRDRDGRLDRMRRAGHDIGRLDVIIADQEDYIDRLNTLNLPGLDGGRLKDMSRTMGTCISKLQLVREVSEDYPAVVRQKKEYDFVIVDSLTGYTETSGLCVGPLSDRLVVISNLNSQCIEQTRDFLKLVGILKSGGEQQDEDWRKPLILVASPVPIGEVEMKKKRYEKMEADIGKQILCKLSYHPQMTLDDSIFLCDYPDEYLSLEYTSLINCLLKESARDAANMSNRSRVPSGASELIDMIDGFRKMASDDAYLASLVYERTIGKHYSVRSDADHAAVDLILESLCRSGLREARLKAIAARSSNLVKWRKTNPTRELSGIAKRFWVDVDSLLKSSDNPWSTEQQLSMRFAAAELSTLFGDKTEAFCQLKWIVDRLTEEPRPDSDEMLARALFFRGVQWHKLGRVEKAVADWSQLIDMAQAFPAQQVPALMNRGQIRKNDGDFNGAISDWNRVATNKGAPASERALAYFMMGIYRSRAGFDDLAEQKDYTAIIDMVNAPPDLCIKARINRGTVLKRREHYDEAIEDYNTVIGSSEATLEQRAKAIYNRALANRTRSLKQDTAENRRQYEASALKDYDALIKMTDVPSEIKAKAYILRGVLRVETGNFEGGLTDYHAVIDSKSLSKQIRATAHIDLGWAYFLQDAYEDAVRETLNALDLEAGSSRARANLALYKLHLGQTAEAREIYKALFAEPALQGIQCEALDDLQTVIRKQSAPSSSMVVVCEWLKERYRILHGCDVSPEAPTGDER